MWKPGYQDCRYYPTLLVIWMSPCKQNSIWKLIIFMKKLFAILISKFNVKALNLDNFRFQNLTMKLWKWIHPDDINLHRNDWIRSCPDFRILYWNNWIWTCQENHSWLHIVKIFFIVLSIVLHPSSVRILLMLPFFLQTSAEF